MKPWDNADAILDGGEPLLIKSEDVFSLQELISITQLISELQANDRLDENSGLSANCVKHAQGACNLVFQELQKRLDALIDDGHRNFTELKNAVEG